jgi:hypothetical protein
MGAMLSTVVYCLGCYSNLRNTDTSLDGQEFPSWQVDAGKGSSTSSTSRSFSLAARVSNVGVLASSFYYGEPTSGSQSDS